MVKWKYGMRLRGFSPLCQPMRGLTDVAEDSTGRYHNILSYDRQLSLEEMERYELTFVGMEGAVE